MPCRHSSASTEDLKDVKNSWISFELNLLSFNAHLDFMSFAYLTGAALGLLYLLCSRSLSGGITCFRTPVSRRHGTHSIKRRELGTRSWSMLYLILCVRSRECECECECFSQAPLADSAFVTFLATLSFFSRQNFLLPRISLPASCALLFSPYLQEGCSCVYSPLHGVLRRQPSHRHRHRRPTHSTFCAQPSRQARPRASHAHQS